MWSSQSMRSRLLANQRTAKSERADNDYLQGENGKQSHGMRAELHHLRQMIKRDMKDLLQAELQKCSSDYAKLNGNGSTVHDHDTPMPAGFATVAEARHSPAALHTGGSKQREPSPAVLEAPLLSESEGENLALIERRKSVGCDSSAESEGGRKSRALTEIKRESGFAKIEDAKKKYCEDQGLRITRQVKDLYPDSAWLHRFMEGFDWLAQLQEPPREGCLAAVESSKTFTGFFMAVIIMNAIFMVIQVNYDIRNPGVGATNEMVIAEWAFLTLYTIELAIKLIVHRLYFFWNAETHWNLLDFSLVCYSIMETVLVFLGGAAGASGSRGWMRSLRLFRITKALRLLRVVKSFKELQLIMNCILGSVLSMFWSVVMLAIMFYMFSLMLVQQTGLYLSDARGLGGDDEDLLQNFGTVETCMWTLFKTTFGGDDWNLYYMPIDRLGVLARVVWFVFIVFTQIALLNILTGIFVEQALELAEGDALAKAMKREEQTLEDASELRKLCHEWDNDKSKSISRDEFEKMAASEDFERYLRFIGLEMSNIEMFFNLICEEQGDGEGVDIPTFVAGCMMLRGSAKSSDLMALMFEVKQLRELQQDLLDSVRDVKDVMVLKPETPTFSGWGNGCRKTARSM